MNQVPGHTIQFGDRRHPNGLREITAECGCGKVFASAFVEPDDKLWQILGKLSDVVALTYPEHVKTASPNGMD